MPDSHIIAAARSVNGQGSLTEINTLIDSLVESDLRCTRLIIDDLSVPWDSPVEANHFRTGCAPLEALAVANRMIHENDSDIVIISGRDRIKSDYSQAERHQMMDIYPECSLPEAYTSLARQFCSQEGIKTENFLEIRDAIFENLKRTAVDLGLKLPNEQWYQPLTELFRGVDCANPVVDFEGTLVIARSDVELTPPMIPVVIKGVGIGISEDDGPEFVRDLATYHALEKAIHYAEVQSGLSVKDIVNAPDTLMEAYTCYPVVPLALLLKAGELQTEQDVLNWLDRKALTCTGGMNLGRAPWYNPALNGLIALFEKLQTTDTTALIHGNGGLGYRQGIALLSR